MATLGAGVRAADPALSGVQIMSLTLLSQTDYILVVAPRQALSPAYGPAASISCNMVTIRGDYAPPADGAQAPPTRAMHLAALHLLQDQMANDKRVDILWSGTQPPALSERCTMRSHALWIVSPAGAPTPRLMSVPVKP
jgi:hypothetical protein